VDLPAEFGPFRFYGQDFDQLSVNSNGWVSPGSTSYSGWSNRELPDTVLPAMLAPNWDDLYPGFGSGVWYYHDTVENRFIVEWDSVHYRNPVTQWESFQVIMFDTSAAAQDGNSEFVFQYRTANRYRSSTIGIQDQTGRIAVMMLDDTCYHRAAARVVPGRAVRFSTDEPLPGVTEPERPIPRAGLRRHPGLPNPIRFEIPFSGRDRSALFDATGRRRLELVPGRNDVRNLPTGVYYLVRDNGSATCKVVIRN